MRSGGVTRHQQQIGALQQLLAKLDAEWETLTGTLQAHLQVLRALQKQREQLFWLLRSEPYFSARSLQTLTAHLDAVEQQIRQVRQEISHVEILRRSLEYRFDEALRSSGVLYQQGVRNHWKGSVLGMRLGWLFITRPFGALWRGLCQSHPYGTALPYDQLLQGRW